MHKWQIVIAGASAAIAFLVLLGLAVYFLSCFLRGRGSRPGAARQRIVVISEGRRLENKGKNKKVHGQYSFSVEAFRWDHHPSLVAEILEHGWTTFAFTYNYFNREKNKHSPLSCGLCRGAESEPEISWEPVSGSNLMQKIRLNPACASSEFVSLHTALPLPGPALGSLGFPQESYFEITIISEGSADDKVFYNSMGFEDGVDDDDGVNLLHLVNSDPKIAPGEGLRLSDVAGSNKNVSAGQRKGKERVIAVGQGASGSCACTMPGLDLGSVGFYSTGAVLLNGQRPAGSEEEMHKWGNVGSVIGCGFEPARSPLYPTIAANYDVTVLVNFGQRSFCYEDANSRRVTDPSSLNCLEDSREFFSIERIDPLWLADKMPTEPDESDLFEITLDANTA
ncbi:hypothetical protein SUGI_0591960 [Cryptomeria japonica]|nr:hypothetical protein SUGI_0591960 [Cryptomeria japonica]